MFTGVTRYSVLAGRIEICAVQANNLTRFWSLLLNKMRWPIPPKSADKEILDAIRQPDQPGILMVLATETASVITLARMLHDQDKAARKRLADDQSPAFDEAAGNIDNLFS